MNLLILFVHENILLLYNEFSECYFCTVITLNKTDLKSVLNEITKIATSDISC